MRTSRQLSPLQIMVDQKHLEKVEYLNCLGKVETENARCTYSAFATTKEAVYGKKTFLTS
jgi:hypothetical protein